jgi:hypothetical protein
VLERSPLVLRDLDLLKAIHERARAVVAFSIVSTPGSAHYEQVCALENLAPAAERRFAAMAELAAAGIPTGTCMMPILPGLCDDETNVENVVRWTAEHGGQFVIAGGLTLADQQRVYFLDVLRQRFPDLVGLYEHLYPAGKSYGATGDWWPKLARRLHELCLRYGISDRVPRPVIPGEKRALNKRVVEVLANRAYYLEIEGAPSHRVWAYRKAAWAIEDLPQPLDLVYETMRLKGLQSIANVGPTLGAEVERLINSGPPLATLATEK